jgi:cytochrome c
MRTLAILSSLLLVGVLGVAQADDIADGAKLYTDKACLTCHGEAGNKPIMTTYPKIAGQNADYLVQQMKDIKSGARNNGQTAAMKALVATVTDDEFAKIAKYLEAQGASTAPAAAPVAAAPATTTPAAVSVTTTTTTPAAK